MRIAVASCWKYRDCWTPFFTLFHKFWPDCPYKVWLLTDDYIIGAPEDQAWIKQDVAVFIHPSTSWCAILREFCEKHPGEAVLLLQDDFLLTSPVRNDLIIEALRIYQGLDAECVRLYPCPGADEDMDDPRFGIVSRKAPYRISCQAAIWRPEYLGFIAYPYITPAQFERKGSFRSSLLPGDIFSFKRDVQPWPLEYICTGIVKGKWTRAALALCAEHGIDVDTSLRPIEP